MFTGKSSIFTVTTWKDTEHDYIKHDLYVGGKFKARYSNMPALLQAIAEVIINDNTQT